MKPFLLTALLLLTPLLSRAQWTIVSGKANPWLSGMPDGSTASACGDSGPDLAPAQSPTEVASVRIYPGQNLTFHAIGGVSHGSSTSVPLSPPDGNPSRIFSSERPTENGIASIATPLDSLIGVFLGPDLPTLSAPPRSLDFSTSARRDYTRLTPALKQPFFIGNGRTSSGGLQIIVAPAGATRLFLGVMDGCGWASNRGYFRVTISDLAAELSIRVSQIEVCWTSLPNVTYQPQFLTDLSTAEWTDLGAPLLGTGTIDCIHDTLLPGQSQRTYRVIAIPE